MSTDVLVQVVNGGLRAVNGVESDKLTPYRGRELTAKLVQTRNPGFHRKYFALLGVAQDMIGEDYTFEQFRALCTVGAGYCEFLGRGESMIAIPKSISFGSMEQTEFERLYQDTMTFICKTWDLDSGQIEEIVRFM